jgi:N-formylglutamate deformylase
MNAPEVFTLHRGTTPLLVSLPHVGTTIPETLKADYAPRAAESEDTDWHLDRLYAFAGEMGASLLVPRMSRYVIDLNRPPEDTPMYPGVNNTELCPTHFFTGEPLYVEGRAPSRDAVQQRVAAYWRPYHDALRQELDRLKAQFGYAILFDGHSIKSELPWLFEGQLPDLNLGTVDERSCAPSLREQLQKVLDAQRTFSHVVDERFKGGYITRHYGRPEQNVHAVQLEMCWRCYMTEAAPYAYDATHAAIVQPVLRGLIEAMLAWRPA